MSYFSRIKKDSSQIKAAKMIIKKKGIVDITHFFNKKFISALSKDTLHVYDIKKIRKDFLMKETDNTPRNMSSVAERIVKKSSKLIPNFYHDESVASFLTELTQQKVMRLPWEGERYVINGLSQSNDTHGWHWDDYSYALIFIAKAPGKNKGGYVECIPNSRWNKLRPRIHQIIAKKTAASYYFKSGSFYLMRSDTTLHRVAPITSETLRVVIAMSWCTPADLAKNIDHKTVYALYGK